MAAETRISLLENIRVAENSDAWKEFAHVYGEIIVNWLSRQDVQAWDIDDIRQEVMIVVHRNIRDFEHSGRRGAFRTWMRRIVANRLRQHWEARRRKPGAHAGPDLSELADRLMDPSTRLSHVWDEQHDRHWLQHFLIRLRSRFSTKSIAAFERIAFDQQPAAQVAAALGMTLGAVRVAQHRVLRALQELARGIVD